MNIPGLITAKRASGAIAARRIVIHGSSDGLAAQAAGRAKRGLPRFRPTERCIT